MNERYYYTYGVMFSDEILRSGYVSDWFQEHMDNTYMYYIYGGGNDGKKALSYLESAKEKIGGFLVSNSTENKTISGYPVYSADEILNRQTDFNLIVASSTYEDEIERSIRQKKPKIRIYSFKEMVIQIARGYSYYHESEIKQYNSDCLCFYGDFKNWREAEEQLAQNSKGYGAESVFERVKDSTELVLQGKAVFERDGVAFYHEEYNYELLTSLLYILSNCRKLKVLDFGGALGSTYYQNVKLISPDKCEWNIVEQPFFVDYGKERIKEIDFFYSIEECVENKELNCIILSSVLQYLDDPYGYLDRMLKAKTEYVLVDRMPLIETSSDHVAIQNVPESIYRATYALWLLSGTIFENYFRAKGYKQVFAWTSDDQIEWINSGHAVVFRGYLFKYQED